MRVLLPLTLAIFMLGCAVTQQTAEVRQQTVNEETRSCELDVAYNCRQPVGGSAVFLRADRDRSLRRRIKLTRLALALLTRSPAG
jgi:hypothetical protein